MMGGMENEETTPPIPPRYRWLKRFIKVGVALLLCLVALRLWWGYEADRRLQGEIDRYRAAGEPVFADEFDREMAAVLDEENAAILYEKAINSITFTTKAGVHFEDFRGGTKDFGADMAAAAELMESNAGVFELVRQARAKPAVAWSQGFKNPAANFNLGNLSAKRSLAKMLRFAANYHFAAGNHDEVVAVILDDLAFCQAINAYPTMIRSLVAWATYDFAYSAIEDLGGGLKVADSDDRQDSDGVRAHRAALRELLEVLRDESVVRSAAARSYYGERASALDQLGIVSDEGLQSYLGGNPTTQGVSERAIMGLLRPAIVLELVQGLRNGTVAARAVADENWPAAASRFRVQPESESLLTRLVHLSGNFFYSSGNLNRQSVQFLFRHLAKRRMAATALAIRLYVVDHGRRPDSLDELVPDYLAHVPADPFSAGNAPIRYKPNAEPPVLYSVGENGEDQGGTIVRVAKGGIDRKASDMLFYLDGKKSRESD